MTSASPFARPGPEAPVPMPRLSLSVAEAATMIGVSARTLWSLIARGELLTIKLGRRRLVRLADLERLLESKARGA